jgi:hypothetical protein
MIIFLDDYRRSRATGVAERISYLDRSSYEEALLSANWTKAEQLMQLLNVSWSQAIRMISLTSDRRGRELSPQQLLEHFPDMDVDVFVDRA